MKSHPIDLNYERLTPHSRARMVQARQRFRYHSVVAKKEPFTGAYYWIPDCDGNWEPRVFPDCFYVAEAGHVEIWPDVVDLLALEYRVPPSQLMAEISNAPYGLPRGRVVPNV